MCYGFPADRATYAAKAVQVKVVGYGSSSSSDDETGQSSSNKYNKKVAIDSNTELECDLSRDDIDLKWSKSYGPLSDYTRSMYGKLFIYYVKQSDSGEYICTAPDGRTARARLTVYDPNQDPDQQDTKEPTDSEYEYAVRVYLDKSALDIRSRLSGEIACTGMTNGPNLEIEWFDARGQRVQPSRKFNVQTSTSSEQPLTKVSTLTISDFEPRYDSGSYECRARVNSQKESIKFEVKSDEGKNFILVVSINNDKKRNAI